MSKKKEYTISIKAETQTDPIQQLVKSLRDVTSVVRLVNLPLRIYYESIRIAGLFQTALNSQTASAAPAIAAQGTAFDAAAGQIGLANEQLAEFIMLTAAATQGASVPGAAAGAAAAGTLVGGITAASIVGAQTSPGETATVIGTGAAIVHTGEKIGQPGAGGFGGGAVNVNIANVNMNPAGMDITQVASELGSELQLALRSLTRNIPT